MQTVDSIQDELRDRSTAGGGPPVGTIVVAGIAGAAGAALAYLFDPQRGKARRAIARDRALAFIRRTARQAERTGRTASAQAEGLSRKIGALRSEAVPVLDDASLAEKVSSELFRDPSIPKGEININVERGVVVLRGQLPTPDAIQDIEARVRRVSGVWDVRNLLHVPGLPAPAEA